MVYKGKNNWLFLDGDSNSVLDQHTGKSNLSQSDLILWDKLFLKHSNYGKSKGIEVLNVIAPNSSSVFHENLDIHLSSDRAVNKILGLKHDIFYPTNDLYYANRTKKTYLENDTHWTDYGALIVAKELLKKVEIQVNMSDFEFSSYKFLGDLGQKVNPNYYLENLKIHNRSNLSKGIFHNGISNIGRRVVYRNINKNLPTCLIFGNCFTEYGFLPIISNYFYETHYIYDAIWDYKLIDDIKPHVIINQYLERFLVRVPNEDRDFVARLRVIDKITNSKNPSLFIKKDIIEKGIELLYHEYKLYSLAIKILKGQYSNILNEFQKCKDYIDKDTSGFLLTKLLVKKNQFLLANSFISDIDMFRNIQTLSDFLFINYKLGNLNMVNSSFDKYLKD